MYDCRVALKSMSRAPYVMSKSSSAFARDVQLLTQVLVGVLLMYA